MRKIALALAAVCFALALPSIASAQLSRFSGNWRNADPATGGITRLQITTSSITVRVHAWGKCEPTDCDWGAVAGIAYGPDVSSSIITTARAVTAVFTTSFSETILTIHPFGSDRLTVTSYTRFTGGSRRSPYTDSYVFVRY